MQTIVDIAPETMSWVIQHIEVEKVNESMLKNIQQWKSGEKKPTFNQVEILSKATNIPLGYFFLKTPPIEDISLLKYRTVDSLELRNPSRNLIDTINDMEDVQEWMRDHLIASGNLILEFVGSQKNNENAQQIAEIMRKELGLKIDWYTQSQSAWDSFKKIRLSADTIGILIMMNGIVGNNTHRKLEIEEFRAFTLTDDYAPLIFINTNDSQNGKLFSLLHEMAHIWIGKNNFFNDRYGMAANVDATETLCNEIAGELLVPNSIFVQQWRKQFGNITLIEKVNFLASYFKCGTTVIARKALNNKYIVFQQYNEIAQEAVSRFNELQRGKKDDESGGNYYNTMAARLDNRFLNILANSVQEGKTLYSDAFRLTHTNRKTFIELLEKIRGGKS